MDGNIEQQIKDEYGVDVSQINILRLYNIDSPDISPEELKEKISKTRENWERNTDSSYQGVADRAKANLANADRYEAILRDPQMREAAFTVANAQETDVSKAKAYFTMIGRTKDSITRNDVDFYYSFYPEERMKRKYIDKMFQENSGLNAHLSAGEENGRGKEEPADSFKKDTVLSIQKTISYYDKAQNNKDLVKHYPPVQKDLYDQLELEDRNFDDFTKYVKDQQRTIYNRDKEFGHMYDPLLDVYNAQGSLCGSDDVKNNFNEYKLLVKYPDLSAYMVPAENFNKESFDRLADIAMQEYGFENAEDFMDRYFMPMSDHFGFSVDPDLQSEIDESRQRAAPDRKPSKEAPPIGEPEPEVGHDESAPRTGIGRFDKMTRSLSGSPGMRNEYALLSKFRTKQKGEHDMTEETVKHSDVSLAEQKKEELLSGDLSDKDVSLWYFGANALEGTINYAVIDNKDIAESDPIIVRFEENGDDLNAYIMIEDPDASYNGDSVYMPQSVPLSAAETALLQENMAKAGHDLPDHVSPSSLSENVHLIHAYEDYKNRYSNGERYTAPVVCFEDLHKGYLDDFPMVHENSDKEFARHCESYMRFFSHNSKAVELYEQTRPYRVIGVTMETDVNGLYGEHKDGLPEKTDFLQEIAKIQADLPAFADLVAQEEKLFTDYGVDMHDYNNDQLGQLVPLMHAGVSKEDFAEAADPSLSWIEMKQKKEQLLSEPDTPTGQKDMDPVSALIEEAHKLINSPNMNTHSTVNRDNVQIGD